MIFLNDIWLYLTPLLVISIGGLIFYGMKRRDKLLGQFVATRLLGKLTGKTQTKRLWIKATFIVLGVTLLGLSLARPQYGVEWIERKARGLDIIFVLDSSKSMLATDLRPTRLDRAKLAIIDLVEQLESDRIGLVAFAGRAFLQTPPTLDYSAFRESLDSIQTDTITRGGSDIGGAITEAANAFPKANNFKVVILLTDGEDLGGNAIKVAKEVADENVKIYAIGLGTPEGEYLRIRNAKGEEEFIRDSEGQPVRSQLDEATLNEIAQLTGGSYARLGGDSLSALYSSVIATLPREERESELQEARIDRYQWPLGIAILFFVIEFVIRRRSRSAALMLPFIAAISLLPTEARAQENEPPVEEETATSEAEVIESQDARELYNLAHGMIKEGQYTEAKKTFDQSIQQTEDFNLQRDSIYNAAHSVFQEGEAAYQAQDFEAAIEKWKEAEESFKSAHAIDPSDQEAADDAALVEARRKALEEFLEQQQQEDQDQQDQGQESDDEQNENDQEQDSEGDEGDQNQEQSDQNDEQENDSSESEENQDEQDSNQNQDEENSPEDQSGEDEQDESSEGEEEGEEQEGEQPNEPTDESGEDEGQSGAAGEAEAVEAGKMSPEQAAALLDSLRDGEKLLPFIGQSPPSDKNSKRKDW